MKALYYDIKPFTRNGFAENYARGMNNGFAYETLTHYLHFWASPKGFGSIWKNIPIFEVKQENTSLEEWLQKNFGATNFKSTEIEIGTSIEGIWRPSLYYDTDIFQALNTSEEERRITEYALRVILEKMDDLFLYIEPNVNSLNCYSHKIRELLILACTEVENFWNYFMIKAGLKNNGKITTNDYVKLKDKLFLGNYKCTLKSIEKIPSIMPFVNWSSINPTKSLRWYDAYNKTKHNRSDYFALANFENTITAIIANIILYIVRFGPHSMLEGSGVFNTIVKQHFNFEIEDLDMLNIYVPLITEIPENFHKHFTVLNTENTDLIKPFRVMPFSL